MTFSALLEGQVEMSRIPSLGPQIDVTGAAFKFQRSNMNVDASLRLQGTRFGKRNDMVKQRFGKDPLDMFGIRNKYTNPTPNGRVKMNEENNKLLDDWILKGRKENPEKFEGLHTTDEIQEQAREEARIDKREFEEAIARSDGGIGSTLAAFSGGIGGSLTDPLNLATIPFGAGASKSILKAAMIEGSINAGVEALSIPAIAAWQKEVGHKYGLGDALANVAGGFVGGAGVTTVIRGAGPAFAKTRQYTGNASSYVLDKVANSTVMPASVRDAAKYLSRSSHIQESAPVPLATGAQKAQHMDKVKTVAREIEEYKNPTGKLVEPQRIELTDRAQNQLPDLPDNIRRFQDAQLKVPNQLTLEEISIIKKGVPSNRELTQRLKDEGIDIKTKSEDEGNRLVDREYGPSVALHRADVDTKRGEVEEFTGTKTTEKTPERIYKDVVNKAAARGEALPPDVTVSYPGLVKELDAKIKDLEARGNIGPATQDKIDNLKATRDDLKAGRYDTGDDFQAEPFPTMNGSDITDISMRSNPSPKLPEGITVKDADRLAAKQASLADILRKEGDEMITLEDGTQMRLRDFADEIKEDQGMIDALTTCRVA